MNNVGGPGALRAFAGKLADFAAGSSKTDLEEVSRAYQTWWMAKTEAEATILQQIERYEAEHVNPQLIREESYAAWRAARVERIRRLQTEKSSGQRYLMAAQEAQRQQRPDELFAGVRGQTVFTREIRNLTDLLDR